MAGYWLKLYTEILDDPKYFRLSDNAKLGMIELMLVAKRVDMDGELPDIDDISFYTRRTVEWWTPVIDELRKIEYIVSNGTDTIIRKFSERQAAVTDSQRHVEYRKRKHATEFENVTDRVTIRDGDTDTEIDTDTEKESESGASAPQFSDMQDLLPEFESITGHKPRTTQIDLVVTSMQAIKRTDRVDYMRIFWNEWITRGYNPYGLAWLTEWARDGTIPAQRKGVEAVVVDDTAERYKYTRGKFVAWGEH